eukprot:UN05768
MTDQAVKNQEELHKMRDETSSVRVDALIARMKSRDRLRQMKKKPIEPNYCYCFDFLFDMPI